MKSRKKAFPIIALGAMALVLLPAFAGAQAVLVVKEGAVAVGGDFSPDTLLHARDNSPTNTFVTVENLGTRPAGGRFRNTLGTFDFRLDAAGNFVVTRQNTGGAELLIDAANNVIIRNDLVVQGVGGCTGCDEVFDVGYSIPTIEDHAELMWENGYLPGIGPSRVDAPINVFRKTAGILNELEKAHIYIEQLNERLVKLERELSAVRAQ